MIFNPMEETWLIIVEDVELLTETEVPIADGVMSVVFSDFGESRPTRPTCCRNRICLARKSQSSTISRGSKGGNTGILIFLIGAVGICMVLCIDQSVKSLKIGFDQTSLHYAQLSDINAKVH